jgi:hypothetical protein
LVNTSEVLWIGPETNGLYAGSPSLTTCANGSLLASHDLFGAAFNAGYVRTAYTLRSDDNGTSWYSVGFAPNMYWATLFTQYPLDTAVYLLGTSSDNTYTSAQIVIAKSTDCGATWSNAVYLTNSSTPYSTGPTPVVQNAGRLWRAFEWNTGPWGSGYSSVVLSAPANATDLLDKSAWTLSGALPFSNVSHLVPSNWSNPLVTSSAGWLEGNAVVLPDGSDGIGIMLRVNSVPAANKAAFLTLSGPTAVPEFAGWVENFPGGMSKFSIRQDNSTGLYVTISNYIQDARVTLPPICGLATGAVTGPVSCCGMTQVQSCPIDTPPCMWCHATGRNNLTLSVSPDLQTWNILATVMTDDTGSPEWMSQLMTGFQYVDWQFQGNDIIAAVRAGYRGSQCYHNSNRILFQRIVDWRNMIKK